MAAIASQNNKPVAVGDNIMIAGLSFQVLTLLIFIVFCLDFSANARRRYRQLGASAFDQDAAARNLRGSWVFRGFLAALAVATICIFWRCVYRVAELSKGWNGPLMYRQDLFIGFEGVMIIVACLVLNCFHPSLCFKEMMDGKGGLGTKKKARRSQPAQPVESQEGKSEPASDVERQSV